VSGEFEKIGTEIGQLVETKNRQYGESFRLSCKVLEALYPNGVAVCQFRTLLAVTRLIDKLFRLATGTDHLAGHIPCPHCGRAFESPGLDIAGYGILIEAAARAGREELAEQAVPGNGGKVVS
jgi:hypothetical protein